MSTEIEVRTVSYRLNRREKTVSVPFSANQEEEVSIIFIISLLTLLCWKSLVDHFKVHWSASWTSEAKRLQSRKNIFCCCNTVQWCISISQQWFLILINKFRLKIRWKLLITMQGSLEVNPSVLIGSFLVAILLYRQFPWKQGIIRYLKLFQNTHDSHVYQVDRATAVCFVLCWQY